jgi:hypothetical protein
MDSRARRIGHLHEGSQLFDIDIGQRQTDADGAASSFDPSGGRMRCERTLRFIRPHEELDRFILGEGDESLACDREGDHSEVGAFLDLRELQRDIPQHR